MKKFICVADYQQTGFHIGDTMTAQEWKEWAMRMNDFDDFDPEYQEKFSNLNPEEAVEHIASIWEIEIVEYDPKNKEHRELKESYERSF
jgi:hypothetical protein